MTKENKMKISKRAFIKGVFSLGVASAMMPLAAATAAARSGSCGRVPVIVQAFVKQDGKVTAAKRRFLVPARPRREIMRDGKPLSRERRRKGPSCVVRPEDLLRDILEWLRSRFPKLPPRAQAELRQQLERQLRARLARYGDVGTRKAAPVKIRIIITFDPFRITIEVEW